MPRPIFDSRVYRGDHCARIHEPRFGATGSQVVLIPAALLRSLTLAILAAIIMVGTVGCFEERVQGPAAVISLELSSSGESVVQGGSATVTATVTGSDGFEGTVNLAVQGLPTGVTGTVSDVQTTGAVTTATVTINVDASVVPDVYEITIRGSGNGVDDTTVIFTLTVTAAPSYDLTLTTDEVVISQGGGSTINVWVARTNFAGAIDLTVEGMPAGVVASFDPTPVSGDASLLALAVGSVVTAGEYTLRIRGVATGLADRTTPLVLTVTERDPEISRTPATITFSGLVGGSNPASETLDISNSGGGTLEWTVSDDADWLSITPASGSSTGETDEVTVSVNTSGLAADTYTATVTIAATGASNTPQTTAVTLTVGTSTDPETVTDLSVVDQTATSLVVEFTEVDNGLGQPASYGIRYAVTPIQWGSADGIEVAGQQIGQSRQVTIPNLDPNTQYDVQMVAFRGTLNVDAVFSGLSNIATGTTLQGSPEISRSPATLTFTGLEGGSNPATQTLEVSNGGGGTLDWSVTDDAAWLSLSPASGSSTGETDEVTVSVSTSGLAAGTYTATVTIAAVGASNTPQTTDVTLTVADTEDYSLTASPAAISINQGAAGQVTVTINRTGFAGPVTLSLSNAPVGVTGVFDPAAPTGSASTLSIEVGSQVALGVYDLVVNGNSSIGQRDTPLTLTVTESGSSMGDDASVIFLIHSTGGNIWQGGVSNAFAAYNNSNGTSYDVNQIPYPSGIDYPWDNYPYDYWNIWVNHAAEDPYLSQPNLTSLTNDYDVIVWKHCYPVSDVVAPNGNPDVTSSIRTDANYRLQYEALKTKMYEHPDKRFVVWTGAARVEAATNPGDAERARSFFQWVVNTWDVPGDNIFIWDFRYLETEGGLYILPAYAVSTTDSHPNPTFSATVAPYVVQRVIDVIEGRGDTGSITGN